MLLSNIDIGDLDSHPAPLTDHSSKARTASAPAEGSGAGHEDPP